MRTIKLLLVSFITFLALMNISPVNAKPVMKVQHLNVNNMQTHRLNSYDIINVANKTPKTLSVNYNNNFSTSLILSNPITFSDINSEVAIDVINVSNGFFTSAMIFNDKLHHFLSYFATSNNEAVLAPPVSVPDSKVIKKKCNNTLSFS